jgi:surfeit locus 1 family protein
LKPVAETRRTDLVKATLFAAIGVAVLIALGVWQLDRKVWKENLIETLNTRLAQAPQDLQAGAEWSGFTQVEDEYRRVVFVAEFPFGEQAFVYTAGSAFRPDVQGAGYWVFAPARLADGKIIVVNRGFVPLDRKDLAAHTMTEGRILQIIGALRWPDRPGMFTPNDEPERNVWYSRDPLAIAKAKNWDIKAPFYIDQESPVPSGGWPKPGKLQVNLPNDHLQYAITWFGLALGLAVVYGFWLLGRLRGQTAASL